MKWNRISRKCPLQYIGETKRMIRERFAEYRGYVNTKNQSKTTGAHFNTRGHNRDYCSRKDF